MLTDEWLEKVCLLRRDREDVKRWVRMVTETVIARYPTVDIYPVYIRRKQYRAICFGCKSGAKASHVAFGLTVLPGAVRLGPKRKSPLFKRLSAENRTDLIVEDHRKLADRVAVDDWLSALEKVLGEQFAEAIQGNSRRPEDYPESDGDDGEDEDDFEEGVTMAENNESAVMRCSLNQILYGPPGTGKTYATIEAALEVLDPGLRQAQRENRPALKQRFDSLVAQERIRFVTFHQSFSYEDFVEGLRATTDESSGQLRYEVVDGVFKSLCEAAAAKVTQQAEAPTEIGQRRIWKMSLGNTLGEDASIYQECLAGGYVLLGYGGAIDFTGCNARQHVQERFAQAGIKPENPATDYGITSVTAFVSRMQVGDLIVVSDGNFKFRAIGEVSGDYQFKPHADFPGDYSQMRAVKWLRQYQPSLPHTELLNAQFSQMTLYELRSPALDRDKLKALLGTTSAIGAFTAGQVFGRDYQVVRATPDLLELKKPNGNLLPFSMNLLNELAAGVRLGKIALQDIRDKAVIEKLPESGLEPYLVNGYSNILFPLVEHLLGEGQLPESSGAEREARVLIIDEINRGNVSRIFGELITLIEESKREGADEALSVKLPYSKKPFSVPKNVYLIGTMNTADRSLAGLDIALRRRFVFRDMPPKPELLDGVMVEGVNIRRLLEVMNERIEALLDRDHCLGHAYFMPLKGDRSLARLELIFRNQILPLLQEYFFEDWQRIAWVLNDHRKADADCFVLKRKTDLAALFGDQVAGRGEIWKVNEGALSRASSYAGVIDAQKPTSMPDAPPAVLDEELEPEAQKA